MADNDFSGWAILELLGHVRTAGLVSEEEHFGCKLGRIDIPNGAGFTTQFFGGQSIYRLTPTTEELARAVALRNQPVPVQRWELPAPKEASGDWPPRCKGCGVEIEAGTGNVCEACAEAADGGDEDSTLDDSAVDDNGNGYI